MNTMNNLPKLNDTPKYETIIPSMNKIVKFRPYLVKEEKILLLAMESNDVQQILNSVVDIIKACILDQVNFKKLTVFDIEYLMLKLRSKSVGEKSELNFACSECNEKTNVTIDLDKIEMAIEKRDMFIDLTDKVKLKMRWPSYLNISNDTDLINSTSQVEQSFSLLINCIESIQTDDQNILAEDIPKKDLVDFIEGFTPSQYQKLIEFVETIPKLEHTVKFECKNQHLNTVKLQGLQDFF